MDIPAENFRKVTYVDEEGHKSQAYIDITTGEGTNKHSDIPVKVEWSDELDTWKLVWEKPDEAWWMHEPEYLAHQDFLKATSLQGQSVSYSSDNEVPGTEPKWNRRYQPKRQTRRQRRGK